MTLTTFRIHPAIGFARVGDSEDFYLAPETPAGVPVPGKDGLVGGLPIRPGTEDTPISASELRDNAGRLKRQAARFRIFGYTPEEAHRYPGGGGVEIKIGSKINGFTVKDIVWTVHVANKKGNSFVLDVPGYDGSIIERYRDGRTPPLRNVTSEVGQTSLTVDVPNINDPARVEKWTTDPGPRSVSRSLGTSMAKFDRETPASAKGQVIDHYAKSFPAADDKLVYAPRGLIDTLGHIETDAQGRLIFAGGYGRACALWSQSTLTSSVDNDGWYDDTADGPVDAYIVLDGVDEPVPVTGAWAVTADPAYAPQILNVVSIWDEIYNTYVRELALEPALFTPGAGYHPDYKPSFAEHVQPFFKAAALQEWISNLPDFARDAHRKVGEISAQDNPAETIMGGLAYVRDPNNPAQANVGAPLMPLSLGDSGQAFMSPTKTQYFFLQQWDQNKAKASEEYKLGPGELMDKAALTACLGGRFSPGIDLTFTVRQIDVYYADWREHGPFRIHGRPMDYSRAQQSTPFLTGGYIPENTGPGTVEPGDMTKFMSIPWHTDYNSCATHPTQPSIRNINSLYWSWPAQRPVNVFVASEVTERGGLGPQRYSVRGTGTQAADFADQGRYQDIQQMIQYWPDIGTVIQSVAIDTLKGKVPEDWFLEAEGRLNGEPDPKVIPWPMNQLASAGG